MKTQLKTLFVLTAIIALLHPANAQSFAIQAGVSFGAIHIGKGETQTHLPTVNGLKTGFTAGLAFSLPMGKHFSFRPELNYVQKGGSIIENNSSTTYNTALNYLELPLNITWNIHAGKGKFFIGAGPAVSMALSGKEKTHYDAGSTYTQKLRFHLNGTGDYYTYEVSINALAGYELSKGIFVTANYNHGLTNINPVYPHGQYQEFNSHFGIKIGYMF